MELLVAQSVNLTAEESAIVSRYGIDPVVMHVRRASTGDREPVFVVARAGNRVLYYDDVEDEFSSANVGENEELCDGVLHGTLAYALYDFPNPHAGGLGPAQPIPD